jgi:hypothetical protein
MAFWTQAGTEPKRNFRWRVTIISENSDSSEIGGVLWWAKTVTTPSFDVSETEHAYLGGKYYFPGKVSWSEVTLSLVDPISPDAVGMTNQLLINSGYMVPDSTGDGQFHTISKNRSIATGLTQIQIEVLNAAGAPMETWTLQQPFIKAAKFGDLDYSSEDLRTVDLTIRYDWATCTFGEEHMDPSLRDETYFVAGVNAGNEAMSPNYNPDLDNSRPVNSRLRDE